jgi:hypothetical protein
MFKLEKLDKNAFTAFLATARNQASIRLRAAASDENRSFNERMARAEQLLTRAEEMFDLNVGVGHISGMICASLLI